jgi:DNA-binding LacI/PurR family transcriptional regulator
MHFDQCPETEHWLEGLKPSLVEIPVREMGRSLARLAREIADGRTVERVTKLPCHIRPGTSTAPRLAERAVPKISSVTCSVVG